MRLDTTSGLSLSDADMTVSTDDIRKAMVQPDGFIKVAPAEEWNRFSWDEIRKFMHEYPIYVLPTTELISELIRLTEGYKKTIEIGAGSGNIGRNLGIRMTDSYLQQRKAIRDYYLLAGQPVINYPAEVWKADALTAVNTLRPDCVIGCYVTHYSERGAGSSWGVKFDKLLPSIKRLILVGNDHIHAANPIMDIPHQTLRVPGLITRNADREADAIYIWDLIYDKNQKGVKVE